MLATMCHSASLLLTSVHSIFVPSGILSFSVSPFPCYLSENCYFRICSLSSILHHVVATILLLLLICYCMHQCNALHRLLSLTSACRDFPNLQVWLRHVERIWCHQRRQMLSYVVCLYMFCSMYALACADVVR